MVPAAAKLAVEISIAAAPAVLVIAQEIGTSSSYPEWLNLGAAIAGLAMLGVIIRAMLDGRIVTSETAKLIAREAAVEAVKELDR